jgi:hypothetical protein
VPPLLWELSQTNEVIHVHLSGGLALASQRHVLCCVAFKRLMLLPPKWWGRPPCEPCHRLVWLMRATRFALGALVAHLIREDKWAASLGRDPSRTDQSSSFTENTWAHSLLRLLHREDTIHYWSILYPIPPQYFLASIMEYLSLRSLVDELQ